MKSHPILFSGPMVRALRAGTKTQTRRVFKLPDGHRWDETQGGIASGNIECDQWPGWWHVSEFRCPYGQPGDRLLVRETAWIAPPNFTCTVNCNCTDYEGHARLVEYPATSKNYEGAKQYGIKKTPSIHVPRWASRITLEITSVRVERLQDISEADAIAEGIDAEVALTTLSSIGTREISGPVAEYSVLWEQINGPDSWDANPWVWVVEFKVVKA